MHNVYLLLGPNRAKCCDPARKDGELEPTGWRGRLTVAWWKTWAVATTKLT